MTPKQEVIELREPYTAVRIRLGSKHVVVRREADGSLSVFGGPKLMIAPSAQNSIRIYGVKE